MASVEDTNEVSVEWHFLFIIMFIHCYVLNFYERDMVVYYGCLWLLTSWSFNIQYLFLTVLL